MNDMKRGELAKRCGINIESLRYYEKVRLLEPPARSESGYRLYTEEDAARVRFIKNAQKLGFTLNEIGELLKLRVREFEQCESVMSRARKKLDEVEGKIQALQRIKKALKKLVKQCEETRPSNHCPILSAFEMKGNRGKQ